MTRKISKVLENL